MTDTEQKKINAICKVANVDDISDLSDGYHTFRQLYYQRMMLFAAIVKQNRDKAWKSLRHADGELCFGGGWFIVGIDTPEGGYTYHYEDTYFGLFDCVELEKGKTWDGHTEKDVTRLLSLEQQPCGDAISREVVLKAIDAKAWEFCDYLISKGENDEQKPVSHFADNLRECVGDLPPVTAQQKVGHCKDCKYFEYDSVAKVNGIPLIVAHEICKRWGDGCKTWEDGYCFLFEPKMQEVEEK